MKSFKHHLTEATTDLSICELLQLPTVQAFTQKLEKLSSSNKNLKPYWDALNNWFEQSQGVKRFMGKIVEMGMCPKKAKWAGWSGKGYRGLNKRKEWFKQIKFTDEFVVKNNNLFLVANGTYQSKYVAQSWSDKFDVGQEFSGSDTGIGVVLEISLTPETTLLSPKASEAIGAFGESEIIRITNQSAPVKMYVNIELMIESAAFRAWNFSDGFHKKSEWWRSMFEKEFSNLGDAKLVKTIMSNPKVKAIMKRESQHTI